MQCFYAATAALRDSPNEGYQGDKGTTGILVAKTHACSVSQVGDCELNYRPLS